MPKYIVTNGSNFRPFTYDELAIPIHEMAQAHRDTQDQYDALSMQTEALRRYISDNEGDAEAKALYDNYVNQLSALQDNLWTHGYTAGTRRNVSAARKGFFGDIQRIGKAIEDRQKRSLEWRDAKKKDPTLITSSDPGLDGLDAYLHDDLHGSDWYAYSGAQFAKEVGADAQARAQERLNSIDVSKDPRMEGWLTQIVNFGATSEQIGKAGRIVQAALANKMDTVPVDESTPEGLLANILMSHINSTGARGRVTPSELNRMFEYGMTGLSQSIGKPQVQTHKDLVWEQNAEYSNWLRKQNQTRAWAKQDAAELAENSGDIVDSRPVELVGEGKEKAEKITAKYDQEIPTRIVRGGRDSGREIKTQGQAAELVFSEAKRRDRMKLYGFDFATEDDPRSITIAGKKVSITPTKKFLQGQIERNGKTYDVIYKPNKSYKGDKGIVMMKEAGQPDSYYKVSPALTAQLKRDKEDYKKNYEWYQKNEPEIFRAAKSLNPDARKKDYEDYDIPLSTPSTEFRSTVMNMPENSVGSERRHSVANSAMGGKIYDRLSSYMTRGMKFDDKGAVVFDKDKANQYRGTTMGIHAVKRDGNISEEVEDPSDVFKWKDGKITNIVDIDVSPSGLLPIDKRTGVNMPGYFIVYTDDGNAHSVCVDELKSTTLKNMFNPKYKDSPANKMAKHIMYGGRMNSDDFDTVTDGIMSLLTKQLWDFFGDLNHQQVEGDTSSKNNN